MSVLDEIVARVRERLAETQGSLPLSAVREEADRRPVPRSFRDALRAPGTSLIAEAKRRSPSRGLLRANFDAAELARAYEAGGARAMSVLTERDAFDGAPDDLRGACGACGLPILRKDFLVDPYQCWEARAWGASAALLIVSLLDDALLTDLLALIGELSMDALVEVHSEDEAERALKAGARVIGVNNRDLRTFDVDLETTTRIAKRVPAGITLVSESGIASRSDVLRVEAAGAHAVLVGESIVTAADPEARVRQLVGGRSS
jgi:indole-3-glycerol phosphate synthase